MVLQVEVLFLGGDMNDRSKKGTSFLRDHDEAYFCFFFVAALTNNQGYETEGEHKRLSMFNLLHGQTYQGEREAKKLPA